MTESNRVAMVTGASRGLGLVIARVLAERGCRLVIGARGAEALAEAADTLQGPPAHTIDFAKEIQPILSTSCYECHGPEKEKAGLRLDDKQAALKGGDTGPAVSLDKPADSLLHKAINYTDGLEMPPSGKLPQAEIETLSKWVKGGLPWSTGGASSGAPSSREKLTFHGQTSWQMSHP